MLDPKFGFITTALAKRQQNQQLRDLRPVQPLDAVRLKRDGQILLNFSANDYLGLAKHPDLIAMAQRYTQLYGAGATASRLVTGSFEIHQALETRLAQACGREAALLFNSGFQANSTILAALLDRQSLVLCDRLIHSSLLQGILASGARYERYRHNDLNDLESRLQAARSAQSPSRLLIVTETLFSMDGDRSDVAALGQLAERYGAILYLDDAHALGVLGQDGMGLAFGHPADLVIGTLGKAFGAFGAFVACSQPLRDYLINCCPGFIYTTALPPAVIGAIDAALSLMPRLSTARTHLAQIAQTLRQQLQQLGYDTGASTTQIMPIMLGPEAKTLNLAQWLEQQGLLAIPIRPPTIGPGTSRIRLALSSCHSEADLTRLVAAVQAWPGEV